MVVQISYKTALLLRKLKVFKNIDEYRGTNAKNYKSN